MLSSGVNLTFDPSMQRAIKSNVKFGNSTRIIKLLVVNWFQHLLGSLQNRDANVGIKPLVELAYDQNWSSQRLRRVKPCALIE